MVIISIGHYCLQYLRNVLDSILEAQGNPEAQMEGKIMAHSLAVNKSEAQALTVWFFAVVLAVVAISITLSILTVSFGWVLAFWHVAVLAVVFIGVIDMAYDFVFAQVSRVIT